MPSSRRFLPAGGVTQPWEIVVWEQALDDLRGLDPAVLRRVRRKLEWLAAEVEQVRLEPLRANLAGFFKLRVGDWRVVFARQEELRQLVILAVAHRRHVYRVADGRLGG